MGIVVGLAIILAVVVAVFYLVSIYNGLIELKNNLAKAWANIDVILKQRHDELPKLIETVKGYMQHEKGLLEKLAQLREGETTATTIAQKAQVSAEISRNITALFARAEAYPELKANENFGHLQQRISGLENELADRREFYNDSVNQFNIRIESVPDVVVARLMGLTKQDMFQVAEADKQDVSITF